MSEGSSRQRRVLIGAYACEPGTGSEPGVGWNWSLQAARFADVHVITRANNRAAIEANVTGPESRPTFHYLDLPAPFLWFKRRTGTYGLILYYYLWQLRAGLLARRLHRSHHFDLVHHITFAVDWLPSGLALVGDVPFLWGPIGGSTHRAPPEIEQTWTPAARRYERVRRGLQRAISRFDPFLAATARRAHLALPYTEEAAAGLPRRTRRHRVVTHIGVDHTLPPDGVSPSGPLHVVTGGRLVHWKGFDLVLEAVQTAAQRNPGGFRVTITGSGPERESLEGLARELGLADIVAFAGRLPTQEDVLRLVASADLYALPTWRDGPPVAILEAMSVGTPVLCLALGATDELVPDDAGIKVDPDPAEVVAALSRALTWAAANRPALRQMGLRAAAHVSETHTWEAIGSVIGEVYTDLSRTDIERRARGRANR